jgi:hypothetical protein
MKKEIRMEKKKEISKSSLNENENNRDIKCKKEENIYVRRE